MKYQLTSTNEEFLRYCEYTDGPVEQKIMMVFISDLGKSILAKAEIIYADGTFDTAPRPFSQIFFFMGQIPNKRPIIVGFALLPDKEYKTYKKLMEVLCSSVEFEHGVLKRILIDFERALWKSFKEAFPGVELVGCNFHHRQAVRRNIQSIGLQSLYGQSEPLHYAVKLFYALTVLFISNLGAILGPF